MDVTTTGRAVRSTISLKWNGTGPVSLPKSSFDRPAKVLPPGVNANLPISVFHELGQYPEWIEIIASGKLQPVCVEHTFLEGDYHCLTCGHNRDTAAEQARAATAKSDATFAAAKEAHDVTF